jgi:hypothetical protein
MHAAEFSKKVKQDFLIFYEVFCSEAKLLTQTWKKPYFALPVDLCCRSIRLLTLILLMWGIEWTPNSISVYLYIQQDAILHSLFISGNCSTCFGWYFHPSPGAQTTVSTESGICHTVTGLRHPQHTQTGSNSSTIAADSSNGVTNTRCCRYSCMHSW